MGYPDALEEIFLRIEAESEQRAQAEHYEDNVSEQKRLQLEDPDYRPRSSHRHRGSVSITRFGQLEEEEEEDVVDEKLMPSSSAKSLSTGAAAGPYFPAQIKDLSSSTLATYVTDEADDYEDNLITQVQQIAGRTSSISRAVNGILPRRLSRTRSDNTMNMGRCVAPLDSSLIIGVCVQRDTIDTTGHDEEEYENRVIVHSPLAISPNHMEASGKGIWKNFSQKLRHKTKRVSGLTTPP